jgi:hypothetical protein
MARKGGSRHGNLEPSRAAESPALAVHLLHRVWLQCVIRESGAAGPAYGSADA